MTEARFTKAKAEAKVGKTIRTLVEFAGVPKGSTGRIVEADDMGDEWDVVIEWDIEVPPASIMQGIIAGEPVTVTRTGAPLRDWFTREEYEKYLEEL